jgi:proteic killer suppression protein
MPTRVEFRPRAYKSLRTLPGHIVLKLKAWIAGVELLGLREIRKRPGFHDEPLCSVPPNRRQFWTPYSHLTDVT